MDFKDSNSRFPPKVEVVQPTQIVGQTQVVQQLRIAEAEIDELKQSMRYVEIQLAKSQEEKEALGGRIKNMNQDQERGQENLAEQMRTNKAQKEQIEHLQRKIDGFSGNQAELIEKSRFKASSYMNQINQREEELGRVRQNLLEQQQENKNLTVTREKFRQQNDFVTKELKTMEDAFGLQKKKIEEQQRLIDSLCVTSKVQNPSLIASSRGGHDAMMQKANEESQRNERIAQGTNRSTFLHLGEKKSQLVSESQSSLLRRQKLAGPGAPGKSSYGDKPEPYMTDAQRKDQIYIADESVPAQIFPLIEQYRAKVLSIAQSRGQQVALIIDDFFGEAHAILKDTHLKEIARIRNENNVEIMKLKRSLEQRLLSEGFTKGQAIGSFDGKAAKENHNAFNVKDVFADNEAERQRRGLTEENELLKKRLRAVETIAQSGNLERAKFMEGASWIAKKGCQESNKFSTKLYNLAKEYDARANNCVTDPSLHEVDGRQFLKLKEWIYEAIQQEGNEIQARFDTLLENVDYHLSEANKQFGVGQMGNKRTTVM